MKLRLIGYWSGGYSMNSEWPDPADLVDLSWQKEERTDVSYYLQHGLYARGFMGYSPCRLCGKVDNGNAELTDGTYISPQGLAHYVRDHSVRLPAPSSSTCGNGDSHGRHRRGLVVVATHHGRTRRTVDAAQWEERTLSVTAGKCDRYMGDISNLLFGFPGPAPHPAGESALSLHVDRTAPAVVVEFNAEPGQDFRAAVRVLGVPDEALRIEVHPGTVNLFVSDDG